MELLANMPTPEQKTQIAICEWLSIQNPTVYEYLIKIDNEGQRKTIIRDGKTIPIGLFTAIKCGLKSKASDILIAWPTLTHYGLWLELKADGWKGPKGKKEKEHVEGQLNFLAKMRLRGYEGKFAVGVDEGINAIKTYLKC